MLPFFYASETSGYPPPAMPCFGSANRCVRRFSVSFVQSVGNGEGAFYNTVGGGSRSSETVKGAPLFFVRLKEFSKNIKKCLTLCALVRIIYSVKRIWTNETQRFNQAL